MAETPNGGRRIASRWRIVGWSAAAAILLLPLVAMQVSDEVAWGPEGFVFAGILTGATGIAYELAARMSRSRAYRAGVGVALAAAFLLVWINAAVGLIGSEDTPLNLMYLGVLAVGILGASIARFRPRGMACALVATALAQALVAAIALIGDPAWPGSGPGEILGLTGLFATLWLASAGLFLKAGRA